MAENTGVTGVITILNRIYNPIYSWFLVLPRQNELSTRPNQRSVNAVKEVSRMSSGKIDISAVVFRKMGGGAKYVFRPFLGVQFPGNSWCGEKKSGNKPSVANTRPSTLMVQWKMDAWKNSSYLSNTAIFHFPLVIWGRVIIHKISYVFLRLVSAIPNPYHSSTVYLLTCTIKINQCR